MSIEWTRKPRINRCTFRSSALPSTVSVMGLPDPQFEKLTAVAMQVAECRKSEGAT